MKILPGTTISRRFTIGAEFLMPITLTVVISIVAGIVGNVAPAMQPERLALMTKPACGAAERRTNLDGFIEVDSSGVARASRRNCM